MTEILLADPSALIKKAADELKKQKLVQPTSWSKFAKTGPSRERLPEQADWWYLRSASILRSVAKLGPIGTQKLRLKYGGKKVRGHQPEQFRKASGAIIRNILKQLEASGLVKQAKKGVHKGRILTPQGVSLLDKLARELLRGPKAK